MKSLLLPLIMVVLMGTTLVGAEEKVPSKETKTMHMKIEGMTCSMCAAKIRKRLAPLCQPVSIDHESGEGQCTYETGKTTDAIVKVVTDAGYKVIEVR